MTSPVTHGRHHRSSWQHDARPGGTLVLQGTATSGQLTTALSGWSSTVSGTSMDGTFSYNASVSGIPGVAVIVSRLSGVTRR